MVVTLYVNHVVRGNVVAGSEMNFFDHLMVVRQQHLARLGTFSALVQLPIEVVKADDHGGDIVATAAHRTCLKNGVYTETGEAMTSFILRLQLLLTARLLLIRSIHERLRTHLFQEAGLPDEVDAISILEFVEDAVAADDNEVVFVAVDSKCRHIRVCDYNPCVSIQFSQLGLDVTEGAAHREPTWEDSVGTQDDLALQTSLGLLHVDDRCVLVNATLVIQDPVHLNFICGLVVVRKRHHLTASI